MTTQTVDTLRYYGEWTADEIAECVSGITQESYADLWSTVNQNPGIPITEVWDSLTDETQGNIIEAIAPMLATDDEFFKLVVIA